MLSVLIMYSTGLTNSNASIKLPVVYYPEETDDVLNNPYMGWVPWASGGPYPFPHRLAYINISWARLEPEKGKYDFNFLEKENQFAYWQKKGVQIVLRINMDYPDSQTHMDIPKWLYDEIKGDGTWYDNAYGKGFSPNYSNPVLIAGHEKLINALAARYDKNNLIPFIAIGSVGHWGEFHTWHGRDMTIAFPGIAVTDQYVSHYTKAFKNKFLLMRRPFNIAKTNNMGLFNDSFGDTNQTYNLFLDYINNGYTDYFTKESHPKMPDFWKTAPSGGEFANYPGLRYIQDDRIDQTLKALRDTHVSWLGPSFPFPHTLSGNLLENLNQVSKLMGYRFVVKSVGHLNSLAAGSGLMVDMVIENKGVAPFYYKWPLELSLSDSKGNIVHSAITQEDITTWLPGEIKLKPVLDIPEKLPKGTYTLNIAILDPATKKPGIDLGISGRRTDGRYSLGTIDIYMR